MAEYATAVFLVLLFLRILGNRVRLRGIPGPWFAGLSNCWRWHIRRSPEYGDCLTQLHEEYDRIVRIGPNCVSISDVTLLRSSRYNGRLDGLLANDNGTSTQDQSEFESTSPEGIYNHPVRDSGKYLEDAAVYQGTIDQLVTNFVATINIHKIVDLPYMLHYFGIDFIDLLTMDDHIETSPSHRTVPTYSYYPGRISGVFSQPTMQYLALNNPRAKTRRGYCPLRSSRRLERCLATNEQTLFPGSFSHLKTNASKNTVHLKLQSIIATFVSAFYCLLNRPDIMESLKDEIDRAFFDGFLSEVPKWSELTGLRYLDAIMKESTRCCPLTAYYKDFKAPKGGMEVLGCFLPEDTTIVCHQEVTRYSRHIYGDCPNTFDPERWIIVGEQHVATMEDNLFAGESPLSGSPKIYAAWMELKKATILILRLLDLQPEAESNDQAIRFDKYPPSAMVSVI